MVDTDTPTFVGYDSGLKAYQFRVTGRWRPACNGDYCWPILLDTQSDQIGTKDAVRIRFSAPVQFKKLSVKAFDACGDQYYTKTTTLPNGGDDFLNAFAGVNDEIFLGWQKTTYLGEVVADSGVCKLSTLPTHSYSARGYTTTLWADLKGRAYQFDAWVNPVPASGDCYANLLVKGGYTHTWGSQSLTWSVGLSGYPWGLGIGVGALTENKDFTVFQASDGYSDPDLEAPRVCNH